MWIAADRAMQKVIIRDRRKIPPFNEPARDLRILNKPLWLLQRDVLGPYCDLEIEVDSIQQLHDNRQEMLVYRDNLYFDRHLIEAFLSKAIASRQACRIAFSPDDKAIITHALPLQEGIHREGDVYVADLWYLPRGYEENARPLVVDTEPRELGYYHIPTYMAASRGDLVFQVPTRPFLSIENWVHVFMANSPFGVFAIGNRVEKSLDRWDVKLRILLRALIERKQLLSCSYMVKVGKNTHIDPTAIVQGPTIIGDNVDIGAGCMISNCIIGNNVNIMHGAQLLLSVVGDGSFLPFRGSLFMSTLMENAMVAQNSTLQYCVIGRNTFIGANVTFTDFNLLSQPLRTMHGDSLHQVGLPILGGCIGHNCRIGAGLVFYPGRIVESDTVLVRSDSRSVITKNVSYEESDHHHLRRGQHPRQYPR